MTDTNIGTTEATEASSTNAETTQATKTFTQDEVNALMARTKSQLEKKFSSKYDDLGDPDHIREVLSQHQKREQEQALKRGEFEKVLQEKLSQRDTEIQKRDRIIEEFKLNSPLLDAAARHRAVNPDQVKALIRNNVRLSTDGEVEVLDSEGKVRYDDAGRLLSVDSYVQNWLQENPHFVQATPSTTSSRSNVSANSGKLDVSKLDMKNPEHRKIYAEFRKTSGIIQ
jgi:hypothetical protein